ncbi:MAG TPA: acyl-CoA dehydrogenase family protein [Acidimicrobiales bacterium]|nr:acyl-CoA dehydrogenase family protein [Acidimicrobiales bacterium]
MSVSKVRAEVRGWLEANWDPDLPLADWRSRLADSGWGCPSWPSDCYGRGLDGEEAAVVAEEFAAVGAVGPATGAGMALAAPTLLAHASDELRRRLLRRILTGEDKWCQLFSEPGNGSDLAGLTTRAVRDGDEWVVNGQKVWTTGAHQAAYGMLLARTDWDAPKHRGITYFAFSMDQAGVEVRPLRQMNGRASFNEVFLTDARVPHANIVGDVNGGWGVALTTLAHERGLPVARLAAVPAGVRGRTAQEAAAEAAEYAKTYEWYPQRAGRPDLLTSRAVATGASAVHRQAVTAALSLERAARWTVERSRAARARGGQPGPEGSVAKLAGSEIARRSAAAHAAMTGAHAMLTGPDSPAEGVIAEIITSVPAGSIAGGTDQIQRNIIGERALGLPREPSVDSDVPFREVRTNLRR